MRRTNSGAITLTVAEVWLVLYAIRDLMIRRRLGNRPLPGGFDALQARLDGFMRETKTCASQSHSPCSAEEELVDTAQAAVILNCTPQYVGRIRDKLGVRQIGSQRVFQRQTVVDYAERKAGQH